MFSEELFTEQTGENFTEFYKEYNNKLIYYISTICNDKEMAKDIATGSYIHAFDNILSYDKSKAKFSTWLFTIAKNRTINEIKSNKKYLIEDISLHEDDGESDVYQEDIYFYDKIEFIKTNIKKLKYPYNEVMKMVLLEKKSYKTVSETFNNKNINTVKSWVKKGKTILKQMLEKEFGLEKK